MTPEQKQILDDVEARIAIEELIPTRGDYGNVYIDEGRKYCRACAVGSMFIGLTNSKMLSLEEELKTISSQNMRSVLSEYFSKRTIVLMESAFETSAISWGEEMFLCTNGGGERVDIEAYEKEIPEKHRMNAARFGLRYPNVTERLKAIIANMRANGGEFIPPGTEMTDDDA
jgi:hypothetical protein